MQDRDPAALPDVLDHGVELATRCLGPWAGVLWLSVIPLRLSQAWLAAELVRLGGDAANVAPHVMELAVAVTLAGLLATWGRSVYVRAVTLAAASDAVPGREALRVPARDLAAHALLATGLAWTFWATLPTLVAAPALLAISGVVPVATTGIRKAGIVAAVRALATGLARPLPIAGVAGTFTIALLLAGVNAWAGVQVALWLFESMSPEAVAEWRPLLSLTSPPAFLLLLGGVLILLEPFWLACHVALALRLRMRATGEDLLVAFRRAWARSAA